MNETLNFQSIIMKLQEFWADYGCLIWQPYYSQIGAGTMNPATFLRVLGPEPWKVGYVEPSIRPDDGRYGENPNRMQMHYQFQVILKPDPGNPQDIYLKSLQALGVNPSQHDIRFVEDNWEQPALGAWGLGWEVWLDGQEITQFTYFQQAGGITLDPVSVELTYGLERIAIALHRVNSFQDIQWNTDLLDGDVNLQAEQEHSAYYFEVADVGRLRQMYALYEDEARNCLEQNLVLPAYDYLLKCSHTFNVLDTRGAVGVTERQAIFGRMREIARQVAEAYLEQRERLEFPWLEKQPQLIEKSTRAKVSAGDISILTSQPKKPAPFLLEIGIEELPVGDLEAALSQLRERVPEYLRSLRLEYESVQIYGTPRRLVVYVKDLAPRQSDLDEVVKGPPADRAFTPDGNPTKAAEGFARSKGVAVTDLQVRDIGDGSYAVALVSKVGEPAVEVLSQGLPDIVAALRFDKSMRWNSSNRYFSRPIRWLLSLYGKGDTCQVVPFEYAGIQSGDTSQGLRFVDPEQFQVRSADEYFNILRSQGVLLDPDERREVIQEQIARLAAEVGGSILDDPGLLWEVTNLVEMPQALRGAFDPTYLELPRQVLTSVMKKHQRYFPLFSAPEEDSELLPYFIAVRNGNGNGIELVTEGNEHVIQARFADAAFFVREDTKKPFGDYLPGLSALIFQTKLGSMLDKTQRIVALVSDLAQQVGMVGGELQVALRAAELCKADLATKMVVEMTSLQGLMGRTYALISGESEAVAQAIFEHYLPRFAGDQVPSSRPGLVVGLADRLDTLAGLFAANLAPTGNKDPFAQRRAALGLVQNLVAWDLEFDLRHALDASAAHLPISANPECQSAALGFIVERLRFMLLDSGAHYDVVDAVLSAQGYNPAQAKEAVQVLESWVSRPDWTDILPAYARCVRITRDLVECYSVDEEVLVEPAELNLHAAIRDAESQPRRPGSVNDFLNAFLPMIPVINRFFDVVLVMSEDMKLQHNRLGLLQHIVSLSNGVADMSKLEGF